MRAIPTRPRGFLLANNQCSSIASHTIAKMQPPTDLNGHFYFDHPAPSICLALLGAFRVVESTRCSGHYEQVVESAASMARCSAICGEDARCTSFSFETIGGSKCFLYDRDAECQAEAGWSTGSKGKVTHSTHPAHTFILFTTLQSFHVRQSSSSMLPNSILAA